MFTYELQRRLAAHGTTVALAAHPGVSGTELLRNSPAALRLPLTWLAPILLHAPATGAPQSYQVAVQQRLWAVSEELAGGTFPVARPVTR